MIIFYPFSTSEVGLDWPAGVNLRPSNGGQSDKIYRLSRREKSSKRDPAGHRPHSPVVHQRALWLTPIYVRVRILYWTQGVHQIPANRDNSAGEDTRVDDFYVQGTYYVYTDSRCKMFWETRNAIISDDTFSVEYLRIHNNAKSVRTGTPYCSARRSKCRTG